MANYCLWGATQYVGILKVEYKSIHTYIIGNYNRLTAQLLTLLMLCVLIFIRQWCELHINGRHFHGTFIFTLRVFARNLVRRNRKKDFFIFRFDVCHGIRTRFLCLISVLPTNQTKSALVVQRVVCQTISVCRGFIFHGSFCSVTLHRAYE